MRFSLRTAQLAMLAMVLLLGLPLLVPIQLLHWAMGVVWQLTLVGLALQAYYARGVQQATAAGAVLMGALQLFQPTAIQSLANTLAFDLPWSATSSLAFLLGLLQFLPLYLGAIVGRRVYLRHLPSSEQVPAKVPSAASASARTAESATSKPLPSSARPAQPAPSPNSTGTPTSTSSPRPAASAQSVVTAKPGAAQPGAAPSGGATGRQAAHEKTPSPSTRPTVTQQNVKRSS